MDWFPYFAAPDDFTGVSNMLLLFDRGTRTVSVSISIADDNIVEAAEICQVSLTLVNPLNPNIIMVSPSLANISILDDDSKSTHLVGWNSDWMKDIKLSLTLFFTAVVIGFEVEEYTTFEPEGVVTLFVSVIEGNVASPITIALSTINNSALGKCSQ